MFVLKPSLHSVAVNKCGPAFSPFENECEDTNVQKNGSEYQKIKAYIKFICH